MTGAPGASPEYLCGMLGISRPVLLAPMAGIAGGKLAGAVSAAGGLGLLGGGYGDAGWIDEQWTLAGGTRIGVGLITWSASADVVTHVVAKQPAAVWLSFGNPRDAIWAVHAGGGVSICQVSSLAEAQAAVRSGANVLVAQGSDAGGHGPDDVALPALVSTISRALPNVPLVAAGGLSDRFDYERMRSLGAAGVALGTAFYATEEAIDTVEAKQRLVASSATDTVRSTVYDIVRGPEWPAGHSGRSIRTELTDRWHTDVAGLRSSLASVKVDYALAVANNDVERRAIWAGTGVGEITEIKCASAIVERFPAVR